MLTITFCLEDGPKRYSEWLLGVLPVLLWECPSKVWEWVFVPGYLFWQEWHLPDPF